MAVGNPGDQSRSYNLVSPSILIDGFVGLTMDRMVNQHLARGVTISKTTESKLTFSNASKKEEGNYTCSPATATLSPSP